MDPHNTLARQCKRPNFLYPKQRSYGRSMIAFLCVASAGFEIFIKTSYNSEVYKPYFDLYMTLWPSLWTPGEALRTQKILLPLILCLFCLRSMPRLTDFQKTRKTHWKCLTISQTSKTSWLKRRLISLKRCAKRSEMNQQPMRKTSLTGRKLRLSKRSFSCLTSTTFFLLLASLVTPKLKRKKGKVWLLDWWKASLLP